MTIQNWASLEELSEGLQAYFFEQLEQKTAEVQPLINLLAYEITTNDLEVKHRWLGDLPDMRLWVGDRHIKMLAAKGFEITSDPLELTIGCKREELRYDKLSLIKPRVLNMSERAGTYPFRAMIAKLNAGFASAGYDGQNFFSAGHASGSNLASGALDVDNYFAAKALLKAQKGEDNGTTLNLKATHLGYARNIEQLAREVIKVDRLSSGASNPAFGDVDLLELPDLTDDCWCVLDARSPVMKPIIMQHNPSFEGLDGMEGVRGLVNFTAKDSQKKSDAAFMRRDYSWGVDRTMGVGFGFHQTIVMSPGS